MVYWHYAYPSKGGMPAGGLAAYDSATHFLGSYGGTLTLLSGTPGKEGKCLYPVVIHNTSGWTSGTRLPGFAQTLAETIKKKTPAWVGISGWNTMSLFKNHARGRYDLYPLSGKSKGGNYDQVYRFTYEADCCAKCVLP